jgi:hypothetical protein
MPPGVCAYCKLPGEHSFVSECITALKAELRKCRQSLGQSARLGGVPVAIYCPADGTALDPHGLPANDPGAGLGGAHTLRRQYKCPECRRYFDSIETLTLKSLEWGAGVRLPRPREETTAADRAGAARKRARTRRRGA